MAVRSVVPASVALFQRIPEQLFGPLASANRLKYWALLCHLHRRRFGPDAPLPPSYGFLQRDITQDIEDHLAYAGEWQLESGEQADTPLGNQAVAVFHRLLDSGWFRVDKYGIEKTVNMAPAVAQLLTQLITFAETGPVFVSGKIRSIDAAIAQVHKGDASGDLLSEAAEQCRNLLVHIRNTGTNVRDLMATIGAQATTAQYVRTFFQDYVQQVFIGDYQQLRTKEHPLSKRQQILQAVLEIDSDPSQRTRLQEWYVNRLSGGDEKRGEAALQRDLNRLYELERIEEYLARLDDEIRSANKRALAYLEYKLRAIRPTDDLLRATIAHLLEHPTTDVAPVFAPDAMLSGARLAQPRKDVPRLASTPLRQTVVSDRTRAISSLARKAQERRSVTPIKLWAYTDGVLKGSPSVDRANLPCTSIEETRAFQTLTSLAMLANSGIARLQIEARTAAPGVELRYTGDEAETHPHLSGKPFVLSRRKRRAATGESA